MLKFTDFIKLYEAYTAIYGSQPVSQPVTQPVSQPVTQPVSQPVTQPVSQPVTQPVTQPVSQPVTQPVTQPVSQPTSADLLSAINALRIPNVQGSIQQPETIDDIICRLGGVKVPQEGEKK